jgi:hypothetical protein
MSEQIWCWLIQRWQPEVTFLETRVKLGAETHRQWSDLAIARTMPCLLGLVSLVTLLAAQLRTSERKAAASSAWYRKKLPTFSDTLTAVRRHIWCEQGFLTSLPSGHGAKPGRALQHGWAYVLSHAA